MIALSDRLIILNQMKRSKAIKHLGTVLFAITFMVSGYALVRKAIGPDLNQAKLSLTTYVLSAEATQKMIVYELHTTEKITKTEKLNMLWRLVSVSDVDVDMLVPVKYAYYIDFKEGFDIQSSSEGIRVIAPTLRSYDPVVDVSAITFVVNEAPFLYNIKKTEAQIRSELTAYLMQKSENLKMSYKEQARASVQNLVQKWLLNSPEFQDLKNGPLKIEFKNENQPQLN